MKYWAKLAKILRMHDNSANKKPKNMLIREGTTLVPSLITINRHFLPVLHNQNNSLTLQ